MKQPISLKRISITFLISSIIVLYVIKHFFPFEFPFHDQVNKIYLKITQYQRNSLCTLLGRKVIKEEDGAAPGIHYYCLEYCKNGFQSPPIDYDKPQIQGLYRPPCFCQGKWQKGVCIY